MRPGHHWLFKFGDAGNGTSCEKKFNLTRRTWEDNKGNGQQALVVEVVQPSGGRCLGSHF